MKNSAHGANDDSAAKKQIVGGGGGFSTQQLCWRFDVVDNGMGIPLDKQVGILKRQRATQLLWNLTIRLTSAKFSGMGWAFRLMRGTIFLKSQRATQTIQRGS